MWPGLPSTPRLGEQIGRVDAKRPRFGFRPTTLCADKGFFAAAFIEALPARGIAPHIAVDRGRQRANTRVRMRRRSLGYQLSQRCRKQIEESLRGG